jgi:hypothetical protein
VMREYSKTVSASGDSAGAARQQLNDALRADPGSFDSG